MYTSVYGRLIHDPIRHSTVGSGSMCFCYLVFQVSDRFGEATWHGMHLVAFGEVAKSLDEFGEDDYVIVSGPTVRYQQIRSEEIPQFEISILVDSVRRREEEFGDATTDNPPPESGPDGEENSIEGRTEAKHFDDDLPF